MITSGLHLAHFRLLCPVPLDWASCECAGIPATHRALSYDLLQMSWMLRVTLDLRKAVGFGRAWKPEQVRTRSPHEEQ